MSECSQHPDAPHGFDRNASLNEDRYVCDCEGWEPPMNESTESQKQSKVDVDLRTRIAAVIANGRMVRSNNELADAVIRELTEYIPPIFATAIQGFAQSELAAMSYHGASKDAFEVMEKMNREALQIAQYATKHEDWNA